MMEVTPHLKSVLKNYQYSATKSLQGPGLSLNSTSVKNEPPSPEGNAEDDFQPVSAPFLVQQVPILAAPDTSSSERSETILEGEAISCFVVGGEKRLCLPQVLNSVLRDFSLQEINRECDELQIYCSRCTPEQLNILKTHAILPSVAGSCGLITKTDAERLCSALLFSGTKNVPFRPRKGATSFPIYHECFGEASGRCYPDLYTSKQAKCIECSDCQCGFSPQQFVCHVHRKPENRTIHWGFDSSSHWRAYLHVPDDQADQEALMKILDELRDRYEGKVPFPPQLVMESTVKRKQIAASELVKDHQAAISAASELPPKKQKLEEYLGGLGRVPQFPLPVAAAAIMQQQLFALEPAYIHRCLQEFNVRSHRSAFKPVSQTIREQKLRSANALELAARCAADPPLLQNPEKVVLMSESERFERTYQPNVALAPPTPKKHRYGRAHLNSTCDNAQQCSSSTSIEQDEVPASIKSEPLVQSPLTNGHLIKEEAEPVSTPPLAAAEKIDSAVSVLQANNSVRVPLLKYNPEIELSTDTEDSASETSEKNNLDYIKLEEVLKSVNSEHVREKVLELFKNLTKERERAVLEGRSKDQERISELEQKNEELERENLTLRRELNDLRISADSNNTPIRDNIIKDSSNDLVTSSSIIIHSPSLQERGPSPLSPVIHHQKSVIASVASVANSVPNNVANNGEVDVIKNTAPE